MDKSTSKSPVCEINLLEEGKAIFFKNKYPDLSEKIKNQRLRVMKPKPNTSSSANVYFSKSHKVMARAKQTSEKKEKGSTVNRSQLKKSKNKGTRLEESKSGSTKLRKYFKQVEGATKEEVQLNVITPQNKTHSKEAKGIVYAVFI